MRPQQLLVYRARARRRRTARKQVLTFVLAVVIAGVFSLGVEALDQYNSYSSDLPDPGTLDVSQLPQSTQILDRNGKLLYVVHGTQIRTVVPLARISPLLRKATIDVEDKNFYTNSGLDYQRLVAAAYNDVTRQATQGASTITQQLVKLKYLTAERSLDRKIREALLAGELEGRFSKDQILETYLNSIFYGHQAYGIEAASETYFAKHASELNLSEASFLAGIPQAPSKYDPLTPEGLGLARQRQVDVLQAMYNQGDISAEQKIEAQIAKVDLHPVPADQVLNAPHFVAYVLQYLREKYGRELVDNGGLRVTTSLDLNLQTQAEAIVRNEVGRFAGSGVNNGALEAINPTTGEILTYVGSADYYNKSIDGNVDNISNIGGTPRQPGSSFKPYVYLTGFANGYTPTSIIDDTQGSLGGTVFHNFDNRNEGNITLRRALVESRNIPAIKLFQQLGYQRVFQTAKSLGITTDLKPELGSAIGSSGLHMLEHTAGYGVFATGGIYNAPAPVLRIQDSRGNNIFLLQPHGVRVVSPQVTYVLNDILLGYAKQWGLTLMGPAAGKSGTTDDGADLWYMGYTPDLVVGTWMAHTGKDPKGNPIGRYPLHGLFGVTTSSYMFKDFLPIYYTGAHKIPTFQKPALIQGGLVCTVPSPPPAPDAPPGAPAASPGAAAGPPISPANPAAPTCVTQGDLKIEGT
jgi:membrane peptidoglycan carboxypeptidase